MSAKQDSAAELRNRHRDRGIFDLAFRANRRRAECRLAASHGKFVISAMQSRVASTHARDLWCGQGRPSAMGSRIALYVVVGAIAVVIAFGALFYEPIMRSRLGEQLSASLSPSPVASMPTPGSVAMAPATPSPAVSAASPQAKPAPAPTSLPAFDVVRIEPSGDAVIAGRAAPQAAVVLTDDGRPIGDAAADSAGEFVILPPALGPGRHPLRLSAKVGAGAPQLSDVYVAEVAASAVAAAPPPAVAMKGPVMAMKGPAKMTASTPVAQASPTTAIAQASPAPMAAASPSPIVAASPAPSPQASASAVAEASDKPAAPATPVVAAIAARPSLGSAGGIVVASVQPVDPAGLEAAGSAPPGANIRLRLNDTLLAEAIAGPDGKWRLTIERGLTPGDYVLEADIVDPAGAKLARADAPFTYPTRPLATVVAAAPAPSQTASPSAASAPDASSAASPQVALTPAAAPQAASPQIVSPQASPTVVANAPPPSASPPVAAAPSPPVASPTPTASVAVPSPSPAPSAAATVASTTEPTPAVAATTEPTPAASVAAVQPAPTTSETPVATGAHAVVADVRTVTVTKGDNLWDLAIHFYGDGLRYADLFGANSTQIHNPNLIYVGQIFVVPPASAPKSGEAPAK
ncbi:MAG: LysM peptidoglycan-binding domain-containing protein [Bradyrhizobium sp.]|nr:MAG: LysM peptidoglycan-binding domain-containing protein [Bradyrhizobium sp.]